MTATSGAICYFSMKQSIARCLFQLLRRDREFHPFSLMLRDEIETFFLLVSCFETRSRISSFQREAFFNSRDEIEKFFLSVSCFETRSRISSFQSHASRRDREFLSLGLVLRDENENLILQSHVSRRERDFFSSVSCFETRTRIFTFSLILRDENFCLNSCTSRREQEQC